MRGERTSRMFSSSPQTSFANILNQDFILTRKKKNFPNEQPLRMKERDRKKMKLKREKEEKITHS